ncbi:MAG: DNA-3-methyladenine glycosylase I [Rhodanobacter sp.]
MSKSASPIRCHWASDNDALMCAYHDIEWGVPLHDDRALFEFLCLEGAQAGLSWRTVLAKREHYRKVFHDFEIARVASLGDRQLERLLLDPGIIRNRLKVFSTRDNAIAALSVIEEFGTLDAFLWSFVGGETVTNHWREPAEVPASTELSDRMSKVLKQHGFRFVGSTICYALMQATGMINDHVDGCFRHRECANVSPGKTSGARKPRPACGH